MESVNVSEIKGLLLRAQKDISLAIHWIENKILIGEINRPEILIEKKPRKKRTPKVKIENSLPSVLLNPGEKFSDGNHPFYGKRRGRKKKEATVPTEE